VSPGIRRALRSGYVWISPRRWLRRLLFWGGAVAVGAAAILFAVGAEIANASFHKLIKISPWLPLLVMPAGLTLVAWITRVLFPGTQGSGIPQTIAALHLPEDFARSRLLSLRIAFGKIALTVLALFSGASVGREGPSVQVGASIMHSLGRFARFPHLQTDRGLIVAGGAAGVAAAFNTPLAGIVFAIEELSRSFEQRTTGIVLTAVIFAGVTSLAVLGDYTYFGQTSATIGGEKGWIAVILCGVVGGALGGLFSRMMIGMSAGLPGRIGFWMRNRPIRFAAGCGLMLALIGIASDSTSYGTGYYEAKQLIEGSEQVPGSYGVLKLLATLVSYASGIPGGIFAPSLAVGAGFGANLADFVPFAPAAAIVILGMVAYFAGVAQAPLTAFIIVMEMTDNHDMVIPLMAAAVLGHGTSTLICRKPLYKALADNIVEAHAAAVASSRPPAQVPQAADQAAGRSEDRPAA
jgi:H+/Cl- antiporter ClcA